MLNQKLSKLITVLFILTSLSSCGSNIFKRADIKDVPVNVNERVKKNIEEGRGIRFGKGSAQGGVFDFASSNELWRASIEVLDFVPFTNASYSGGILITEWFDGGSNNNSENKRNLKITVRFLTNEIRSDALSVSIHEKICKINDTSCSVKKISSNLENEIKIAILKRAAFLEKNQFNENAEEYRKEKRSILKDR
jgi:hypothetical protein